MPLTVKHAKVSAIADDPTKDVSSSEWNADHPVTGTLDAANGGTGTSTGISAATQTALDLKAPLASPAFTGTPTGITKAHVGLGNVDNTSDANKPVSTAQQTALDAKQASDADLTALAAVTGTNTIYYRSAANTWTAVTMGGNMTFTGGTLNSTGGSGQPADADLTAIAALATTGIVRRTAADTWTASNAVTNAEQATMAAYTLKANSTSGAAVPADITIAGLTTKATPTAADWVLISDTAASAAFKKAAWPTGGSGTPGGATTNVQFNNAGAFGGTAALTWTSPALSIGAVGAGAQIKLTGNTSGVVTFQPATSSTTYNFNLPSNAGTSGQPLLSGGGGSTAQSYSTLGVAHGGTGSTTAAAALTALGAVPKAGGGTLDGGNYVFKDAGVTTSGWTYFGDTSRWVGFSNNDCLIGTINQLGKLIIDRELQIAPSTGSTQIHLDKAASGQANYIWGTTGPGASIRWRLDIGDTVAETGSNAGSHFAVNRYSDAGAYISTPLHISRATGAVTAANGLNVTGDITTTGSISFAGAGQSCGWSADATATYITLGAVAFIQHAKATHAYNLYLNNVIVSAQDSAGNLTIYGAGAKPGGGAWTATSDARIKNVEGEYTRGLAAILALRPVYYTYKGNDTPEPPAYPPDIDEPLETRSTPEAATEVPYPNSSHVNVAKSGKKFAGLIAQEVEQVIPEMVAKRSGYIDGVAVDDLRELDTTPLIFALVNAVKELTARVEALEPSPAPTKSKPAARKKAR